MKTSLRLAFSAAIVSFITFAASGAPLPFMTSQTTGAKPAPTRLLPPDMDGQAHAAVIGMPSVLRQVRQQ